MKKINLDYDWKFSYSTGTAFLDRFLLLTNNSFLNEKYVL